MISVNQLVGVSLVYVAFLFAIAFFAERASVRGKGSWLRSPLVYTLSLSIYCTAWTFYGAVGYAARSGMEFVTIYLGPSLVMIGWWWVLRKLVRIGQAQRITSIADLISSRYGKSTTLAVLVTLQLMSALAIANLVSRKDEPPGYLVAPFEGVLGRILCLSDMPLVGQVNTLKINLHKGSKLRFRFPLPGATRLTWRLAGSRLRPRRTPGSPRLTGLMRPMPWQLSSRYIL